MITRDGVTLSQNSDQMFTNATGSEFKPRQTGGSFVGLSVNGALIGGFGFGGGISLDIGATTPSGTNQFYINDFAGKGGSYNAAIASPLVDFGVGAGGSLDSHIGGTKAMDINNFGRNSGGYKTGQVGFSPPSGIGVSAMYSYGRTWGYK